MHPRSLFVKPVFVAQSRTIVHTHLFPYMSVRMYFNVVGYFEPLIAAPQSFCVSFPRSDQLSYHASISHPMMGWCARSMQQCLDGFLMRSADILHQPEASCLKACNKYLAATNCTAHKVQA